MFLRTGARAVAHQSRPALPAQRRVLCLPAGVHHFHSSALRQAAVVDIPLEPQLKEQLVRDVSAAMHEEQALNPAVVQQEINYFFNELGMHTLYFKMFPSREIATHVHAIISAKQMAVFSGGSVDRVQFHAEREREAVYICAATQENRQSVEAQIEEYLSKHRRESEGWNLSYFKSSNPLMPGTDVHLAVYAVTPASPYLNPKADPACSDITQVATARFQETKLPHVLPRYQEVVSAAHDALVPVSRTYTALDGTTAIVLAYNAKTDTGSRLRHLGVIGWNCGMVTERKFVETFANGVQVYTLYVKNEVDDPKVQRFIRESVTLDILNAKSPLVPVFEQGTVRPIELTYITAAAYFCYYFMNLSLSSDAGRLYGAMKQSLKERGDAINLARLEALRTSVRREALSHTRIQECIREHLGLVHDLFADFQSHIDGHLPLGQATEHLERRILHDVKAEHDQRILLAFLTFNAHVAKTNFNKVDKAALAIQLDPAFLSGAGSTGADYLPVVPFGLLMLCGSNWRGFHLRFTPISRGGVKVIHSPTLAHYNLALQKLFDDSYALAYTQMIKTKDIPEGGAKGTILVDHGHAKDVPFMKYVDGILDLVQQGGEGISVRTRNNQKSEEEFVFLGPDEFTADLMHAAAIRARDRGYTHWKAFTTGKGRQLGGIPPRTATSLRAYVEAVEEKLQLKPEEVTVVLTGGPSGDLGRNFLRLAKEKIILVVDHTGVAYDPAGLDRTELLRLANAGLPIARFDLSKLDPSKGAFKVRSEDRDVRLPDGTTVADGTALRNTVLFSPSLRADFLVPCGGDSNFIHVSNAAKLVEVPPSAAAAATATPLGNKKGGAATVGKPLKFKYIIEGANMFLTEDARLILEQAGVVLYKDASTNKGGVTSSSFEVLAALSMTEAEHEQWMRSAASPTPTSLHSSADSAEAVATSGGTTFYDQYLQQVTQIVKHHAKAEFEFLWNENQRTGKPRTLIANELSAKIRTLKQFVDGNPSLWANHQLVRAVLSKAVPPLLLDAIGLDRILERVPQPYLKAMFSSYLASTFVYQHHLDADEFTFFLFMRQFAHLHVTGQAQHPLAERQEEEVEQ